MRREVVVAAIAVVALTAVAGMLLVAQFGRQEDAAAVGRLPSPSTAARAATVGPPEPAAPKPEPMAFSDEGLAGEVARSVERPARPGNVRVAVRQHGDARWACILVHHAERYAEPDRGMGLDDFPGLRDAGFRTPPPQISRGTTSVYRSMAKRAMGYDRSRGDRILILLCPRDQWPTLALRWPPAR